MLTHWRGLCIEPLFGAELRALRQMKREYPETDYVFMTERKAPITADTFRKIIARAGEVAKLGLSVHPHMLGSFKNTREIVSSVEFTC